MPSKKTPKPIDPMKAAEATTKSNIETAQAQAKLGMTGQESDFGSLQYVADPNSPSGYKAVSSLSPEEKALMEQQQGIRGTLNTNINDTVSTPFDLNAARGTEISDIQQTFLDPQWERERAALENRLHNKGVRPGQEQYETEMRQFGQQKDDAYNKMFLDAFSTANNAALTQRNLPISDYTALNGLTPNTAAPVNTPAPGVSTTPVGQYMMDDYKNRMDQYNNQQSGLFGLAGTALGGWAKSGFALPSDRRLKTDIRRVGKLDNGLPVYAYRYKNGVTPQIGLMAQDVEKMHPGAVVMVGDYKHVDYAQAVL